MKQVYIIRETKEVSGILNGTYNEILAALQHRRPGAKSLIEDDEMSQLHDLLALLRLGHIRVGHAEDDDGRFMLFEINEDTPTSS